MALSGRAGGWQMSVVTVAAVFIRVTEPLTQALSLVTFTRPHNTMSPHQAGNPPPPLPHPLAPAGAADALCGRWPWPMQRQGDQ